MSINQLGENDASLDELLDFVSKHHRAICKAPIIATFMFFSVTVLSNSLMKGLFIALICLVASLFRTWARLLEPLSFILFMAAVLVWCNPSILSRLNAITN